MFPIGRQLSFAVAVMAFMFGSVTRLAAKPVDSDKASKAAETFLRMQKNRQMQSQPPPAGGISPGTPFVYVLADTREIYDSNGKALAYVVELDPEGFIITSADDNITPVIGYSYTDKFPFETSRHNVLLHLITSDMETRLQMSRLRSNEAQGLLESGKDHWRTHTTDYEIPYQPVPAATQWGPLITTQWHQNYPYNAKCPLMIPGWHDPAWPEGGPRCPVGCTAIAMAQIINYWNYPFSVSFSSLPWPIGDSYTSHGDNGDIRIFEDAGYSDRDFPTVAELNSVLSAIEYGNLDELKYLCFATGLTLHTRYGEESGARLSAGAFKKAFGFGSASRYLGFSSSQLMNNIKNGWPALIGIKSGGLFAEDGHVVIVDGYDSTTGCFHINCGWEGAGDWWYSLPSIDTTSVPHPGRHSYDTIHTSVTNICPYQGWSQYGGTHYNNFLTTYAVPDEEPIREKWWGTTSTGCQGMIVGTQNNIYITKNPLIINDPVYHPALVVINHYGEKVDEIEIAQTSSTISHPVESPDGNIYVGAGDGIYRIRPRNGSATRIYYDPGNDYYGDHTPRLDEGGRLYIGSDTTLVCLSSTGSIHWIWNCPSGGVMYTGIPSVDTDRGNVYLGYWKSSSQTAHMACINRLTGSTRYEKSFSDILSADRGIHTPAIGSDGTVYASVRTKIYALTPGSTSFGTNWVQDKQYARYQPIALGPDDTVYTEYWTLSGSSWYVTLAALYPEDGEIKWEVFKPDVGTYTSFGQPLCGSNGVIIFPVKWDTSPDDTVELFAYKDNGHDSYASLWDYEREDDPASHLALGPGATVYLYGHNQIVALSNGEVGDPDGGGMAYYDNIRPYMPENPIPADKATDVALTTALSWDCSDPEGNSIKYSLFVGESGYDMVPVASDLVSPSYVLNNLQPGTHYAWKVIATDGQAVSEGPTWVFATEPMRSDLYVDGSINMQDYAILAGHWMDLCSQPSWCERADIDHSGEVDCVDLWCFVEDWLNPQELVDETLIAHWKFDEGTGQILQDSVGDNDGDLVGDPNWVYGISGMALEFDGNDDHVSLSETPLTGTGDFSILAWVKTVDDGNRQTIINYGTIGISSNQELYLFKGYDNKLHFDLRNTAGPSSEVAINDGTWHQVGVVNSGGSIQLYVDGSTSGSAQSMSPEIVDGDACIGVCDGHNYRMDGAIDEIRIYDRALTDTEVEYLHGNP